MMIIINEMIIINKEPLHSFKFPGGEWQVHVDPDSISNKVIIKAYLYDSDSILKLILAVDAIREINPGTSITLVLPYLPYARQDRVCSIGESLSIRAFSKIINSLNLDKVIIYDPHSDVGPALINNCAIIDLSVFVFQFLYDFIEDKKVSLLSPDAGAEKKVIKTSQLLKDVNVKTRIINASKRRNPENGHITNTNVYGDITSRNILVLDDICDGGRTFIELGKVLKEKGANDLFLYVTHGIFSKGLEELKKYYKHIFCIHTMLKEEYDPSYLTIFNDASILESYL